MKKIKNNDFSVEPVTVEDVAQLGEDLSYARSALKSKRFIAAIKPLNSPLWFQPLTPLKLLNFQIRLSTSLKFKN